MRKLFLRRISALLLTFCFIIMNAVPALATESATTADAVRTEAQTTANYLLSQTDFSDLSDASKFYNCSRNLILAIRAGVDCNTYVNSYLTTAKKLINADGTLNVKVADYGYPNDTYSSYAFLLIVLALSDNNPADFNGANLVTSFNNILKNAKADDFLNGYDSTTYATTGVNPYYVGYINSAVEAYADSMPDYATISANLKNALTKLTITDKGIDYSGTYSADNNGAVYPHFAKLYANDKGVKALIDNALVATEKTYFDANDGTSHSIYSDWTTGATVDEPSPNSTALALALYAQFGKTELAAQSYNALIKNYKSQTTAGSYTYAGADSIYSTQDALVGLVTYLNALESNDNPFDVTAEVEAFSVRTGDANGAYIMLYSLLCLVALGLLFK